jgi:hypothetical protein
LRNESTLQTGWIVAPLCLSRRDARPSAYFPILAGLFQTPLLLCDSLGVMACAQKLRAVKFRRFQHMNSRYSIRRCYRVLALLLVLAVPVLCAMARRGWYLSSTDHAHYLIDSSKTKLVHGQILHNPLPLCEVTFSMPPFPQMRSVRYVEFTSFLTLHHLDVNISLQRRPPPILLL